MWSPWSRCCKECGKELEKRSFSNNQWRKGVGVSCCNSCVHGSGATPSVGNCRWETAQTNNFNEASFTTHALENPFEGNQNAQWSSLRPFVTDPEYHQSSSRALFQSHLLVRRNTHSNFIALSSLALVNAVEPIVNVHPAGKTQKAEEAKSSEMSQREIKEKCIKTKIKKEWLKPEMEEICSKLHIKKEGSKTLCSGTEGEYIEPDISKEWFKLESKEECIKTEIKEECMKLEVIEECIKLEGKERSIKLEDKEGCISLRIKGAVREVYLFRNSELKGVYRKPEVEIEHAEQKMKEEIRKVPDSLDSTKMDIFGNTLTQEDVTNSNQYEIVESGWDKIEDGESPGTDDVDMDAQSGAVDGTGQVPMSLRPLMIPPPPPDAHSAFRPITEYKGDKKRKLVKERETQNQKKEERVIERDTNNFPTFKVNHVTVCSTTLWVGRLSRHVEKKDLFTLFGLYGEVNSIDLIRPRGCAYVEMKRRTDAENALEKLRIFRLSGKRIKLAWAPGKRVKDMEWKDYFDFDLGAFFIPLHKLDSWLSLSMVD